VISMRPLVIDTDVLSAVMRRDSVVLPRARLYLAEYGRFTLSVITQYELLRGLQAKEAHRQIEAFRDLCNHSRLLQLTPGVAAQAAGIYANLHQRGELIGDADILIAATAIVHGCGVLTHNARHFRRISGLHVEDWIGD